jgi:hypothetical protein
VARGRSPEEFFEVFREVQTRKKRDSETEQGDEVEERPAPREQETDARTGTREKSEERPSLLAGPPVTLSRTVVAIGAAALLLVLLATYLIAWQRGWQAHADARRKAAAKPPAGKAQRQPARKAASGPELVDGKVFTLLVSGSDSENLASVKQEVAYLNGYAPFRVLGLEAYAYTDSKGRHRVCARGFRGMSPERRQDAKHEVRRLRSRHNKLEYKDADFFPP